MKTDESETRIVIQPESSVEQRVVSELFTRLNNIAEAAPSHPTKVGSTLAFYTLDLGDYDDLDHVLWADAECGVDANGRIDPDPGSRALVVVHSPEEQGEDDDVPQEAVEEAVESLADDAEGERDVADPPFDPGEKTVDDLIEELEDDPGFWSVPLLRGLYEAEVDGEARKTALEAIEGELDERTEQEVVEA